MLEIAYKAGWKKGTKIKFAGAGHEDSHGQGQTIVFVVEEKPHPRFKREDDDAVLSLNISLADALAGPAPGHPTDRTIEHLDGRKIKVMLPRGVSREVCLIWRMLTTLRRLLNPTKKPGSQAKASPSQKLHQ